MAEKRSPLNVYTTLLAGATLIALASLIFVLVRANQLTGDSPISLLQSSQKK